MTPSPSDITLTKLGDARVALEQAAEAVEHARQEVARALAALTESETN